MSLYLFPCRCGIHPGFRPHHYHTRHVLLHQLRPFLGSKCRICCQHRRSSTLHGQLLEASRSSAHVVEVERQGSAEVDVYNGILVASILVAVTKVRATLVEEGIPVEIVRWRLGCRGENELKGKGCIG
ncbi:hypothetical protein PIB30_044021 [Stylosanthes scabra]|uniref:Uncharacterized protein n=1 Tax=Stylosanthes scabra TaxID=79078 RepID=A0ABU6YD52_9FABA|nr:hypothetical protein [Stylosanthes scabra]